MPEENSHLELELRLNDDPMGHHKRDVVEALKSEAYWVNGAINAGLSVEDYNAHSRYLASIQEAISFVEVRWGSASRVAV